LRLFLLYTFFISLRLIIDDRGLLDAATADPLLERALGAALILWQLLLLTFILLDFNASQLPLTLLGVRVPHTLLLSLRDSRLEFIFSLLGHVDLHFYHWWI
jgi:hypothetical protein